MTSKPPIAEKDHEGHREPTPHLAPRRPRPDSRHSPENLRELAPLHRRMFTFVLICLYTYRHGAHLVARTYMAWLASRSLATVEAHNSLLVQSMKTVFAYVGVAILSWRLALVLFPRSAR